MLTLYTHSQMYTLMLLPKNPLSLTFQSFFLMRL